VPGIGVITNPHSRRNRRNPELARQLAYILGERGTLQMPHDLDALDQVARLFLEREVEVVAINGGDGTNHRVLSALVRVYGEKPLPIIAMLRGGTMNTAAGGLGIRGTPEGLLGQLTGYYASGAPLPLTERNLVLVDDNAGFIFGNGLVSRFLEAYYEGSEPTPAKAAWLLAKAVGSAAIQGPFVRHLTAPIQAEVTLDGQLWPVLPWTTIGVATVDDIGLGFRPFHEVVQHPGTLQAVGFGCSPLRFAKALPSAYRGRPIDDPAIISGLGTELVISTEGPQSYMIDGDFHQGGQSVCVRLGPRVRLVTFQASGRSAALSS
jgi:diacylglycerol kinase (ATP)